jgi:hypothetical protein
VRKIFAEWYRRVAETDLFIICRILAVLIVGYLIYEYWRPFVNYSVWAFTPAPSSFSTAAPWFIVGATALGFFLYRFRTVSRAYYGLLEIVFGIVGIAFSASIMDEHSYRTSVLQMAAGTYIIVRGTDNLKIALDAQPQHPLWWLWLGVAYLPQIPIELMLTYYSAFRSIFRAPARDPIRVIWASSARRNIRALWNAHHRTKISN